jgi:hypothetical protein
MTEARASNSIGIRTVPALAGLRWIRLGFRAFGRQPGGFMGMFGMFLLAMLAFSLPLAILMPLASSLRLSPVFVDLLGVVLMPLLSLGFMLGTEAVTNDLRIRPALFFAPLHVSAQARRALLTIGLVYVGVLCVAYFIGNGIDNGEARNWFGARLMVPSDPANAPDASASSSAAASSAAIAALVTPPAPLSDSGTLVFILKLAIVALGSIPLWHAPALVHWGRQGAAKALFGSVVALWRTRAAFIVFLLGWFGIGLVFSVILATLDALLDGSLLLLGLAMVASWAMSAVFYVTLWFGFVDTFQITSTEAARAVLAPSDNPGS